MRKTYRYSAKTLKEVNHKIASNPEMSKKLAKQFIEDYFNGLEIPDKCISIAVEKTFDRCSTQEEFNVMVKDYLLRNLKRM